MTIMELGALGEFVGSIGVIATLVYLAIQIRQNSMATKAQAVQSTSDKMIDISLAMSADASYADLFNRAASDFSKLDPGERVRTGWLWFAVMRGQETLYHHYLEGNVDPRIWASYAASIDQNAKMRGFRQWWDDISGTYAFASDFDAYVTEAVRKAEASGEPYEWFGGESLR
jgi:hypothetical protein